MPINSSRPLPSRSATAWTPSGTVAFSAVKEPAGPPRRIRVARGPATMRSAAPLLSRSAVRRRAAPGSARRRLRSVPPRPPSTIRASVPRRAADGAVAPEHEQIERRSPRDLDDGRPRPVPVRRGQRLRMKAAAAQVDEDVDAPDWSRNTASGTPSPSRSAQTNPRAPVTPGNKSRGVNVPSPLLRRTTGRRRAAPARDRDRRRCRCPPATGRGWRAQERGWQLRRGRDVGEAARVGLPQQAQTARTRHREIRAEVVVRDRRRRRRRAVVRSSPRRSQRGAGHFTPTRQRGERRLRAATPTTGFPSPVERHGANPHGAGRRVPAIGVSRERQRLVGRRRRRVRILQAQEAHRAAGRLPRAAC